MRDCLYNIERAFKLKALFFSFTQAAQDSSSLRKARVCLACACLTRAPTFARIHARVAPAPIRRSRVTGIPVRYWNVPTSFRLLHPTAVAGNVQPSRRAGPPALMAEKLMRRVFGTLMFIAINDYSANATRINRGIIEETE